MTCSTDGSTDAISRSLFFIDAPFSRKQLETFHPFAVTSSGLLGESYIKMAFQLTVHMMDEIHEKVPPVRSFSSYTRCIAVGAQVYTFTLRQKWDARVRIVRADERE